MGHPQSINPVHTHVHVLTVGPLRERREVVGGWTQVWILAEETETFSV